MDEKEIRQKIAQRLRKNRMVLGYSQEEVAELLDISVRQYRRMESGKTSIHSYTIMRLCTEAGFDDAYILTGQMSVDRYITAGMQKMPEALYEECADRLNKVFSDYESIDVVMQSPNKEEILNEAIECIDSFYQYGIDHMYDKSVRETAPFCATTNAMIENKVPKRIKRKTVRVP